MPSSSLSSLEEGWWKTAEGQARAVRPGPRRGQRLLPGLFLPEGNHAGDLPLGPHLVDLGLEIVDVLFDEVGEAPLLEQVLAHGLTRPALDDGLGLAVVPHDAVLDLVEREDAGLDGQLAQL